MGFAHEVARRRRDRRQGRASSSPRSSPTGRWRRAPASSWCRTSPAARSTPSCAPTPRAGSPTSAPAPKAGRRPELPRQAQADGWPHACADAARCPRGARRLGGPAPASRAMNLDLTQLVAIAAALGWASGLRLYAVVFLTGAGRLRSAGSTCRAACTCCRSPWCSAPAALMLFVEFFVDKIPGLDSVWDAVHTVDPDPRRRGAGGRGVRRRRGELGRPRRRCSAAGSPRPATSPRRPPAPPPTPRPSRSRTSPCRCSATALVPVDALAVVGASGRALRRPRRWPWSVDAGDDLGALAHSCAALPARWPCAIVGRCLRAAPQRGDLDERHLPSTRHAGRRRPARRPAEREADGRLRRSRSSWCTGCRPPGCSEIEVTSFVSPKWVPQMARQRRRSWPASSASPGCATRCWCRT